MMTILSRPECFKTFDPRCENELLAQWFCCVFFFVTENPQYVDFGLIGANYRWFIIMDILQTTIPGPIR